MKDYIDPKLVPYRILQNGDKMPCIGMGTFGSDRFSAKVVSEAVADALRTGYRMFDCAPIYGNEHLIGQVFENAFKEGIAAREELFVISKVWNNMHGRGDALISLAKTLKDLRLDYLDAYFVHWPFPNYHDPGCDGDARNTDSVPFTLDGFMVIWRQMERLHDLGLVKHIAMSNMTIPKLDAVLPQCRIMPTFNEMELHPSFQQPELYQYCEEHDIKLIGYSPIGSPKRPERDIAEGDYVDIEDPVVVKIAKAHNCHPSVICLKWAIQKGHSPIPFSIHRKNYISNLRAVTTDPLTDNEMNLLLSVDNDCRLIKGQVFLWPEAKGWEDLWDLDGVIVK